MKTLVEQGETLEDKIMADIQNEQFSDAMEREKEMWIETQPYYAEYEKQFKKWEVTQ